MLNVVDRASDTIQKLREMLDFEPIVTSELVEHSDYSYTAAGHRLHDMLDAVTPASHTKTVLFAEPSHVTLCVIE